MQKDLFDNILFDNILNEGDVGSDPAGATHDAYLLTDRNILVSCMEKVGSTVVTAMVSGYGRRLIVANLGGLRAVLCKYGKFGSLEFHGGDVMCCEVVSSLTGVAGAAGGEDIESETGTLL